MSKVVAGLKYSKEHEWVKMEGNLAVIGITDSKPSVASPATMSTLLPCRAE